MNNDGEKKPRIQYESSENELRKIEKMQKGWDKRSTRELLSLAISFLWWYFCKKTAGKKFFISDENGENLVEVEFII